MFQTYIFDLYGTLVDIRTNEEKKAFWRAMAYFYSLHGATYHPEELKERYLKLTKSDNPEKEIQIEPVFERLYTDKGAQADEVLIHETGLAFRAASLEKLTLFPGVKQMLKRLKEAGAGVYLLSNAQRLFTEAEMESLELTELFDGILYSSDIGFKKPDSRFFAALFERYGLEREGAVMIGNDRFADVEGAVRYGIDSMYIHTKQSSTFDGELPKNCIRLEKISEVLDK